MCVCFLFQRLHKYGFDFYHVHRFTSSIWMPFLLFPIPKITIVSFAAVVVFRSARQFHPLNKCCVYFSVFCVRFARLLLWTQRNASFLRLIVCGWVGFNRCICFDEKLCFPSCGVIAVWLIYLLDSSTQMSAAHTSADTLGCPTHYYDYLLTWCKSSWF